MNKILFLILLTIFTLPTVAQNIELDKKAHFLAGSSISMATYLMLEKSKMKKGEKIAISISVAILAGILKESHDKSKGGVFDTNDLFATTLGSVSIIIPIRLGRK